LISNWRAAPRKWSALKALWLRNDVHFDHLRMADFRDGTARQEVLEELQTTARVFLSLVGSTGRQLNFS
jgi:hypothetical protein